MKELKCILFSDSPPAASSPCQAAQLPCQLDRMPLYHRENNKHEAKKRSVYNVQSYRYLCIIVFFPLEPQFNISCILTSYSDHQTRIFFLMVCMLHKGWVIKI